jgi:DNA-nicking Smr family endonuclease
MNEQIEYPIDGVLDLHMFQPREARSVVDEYIHACRERGILSIRIIHGKGQGVLGRMVRSHLEKSPAVKGFSTANDHSSWGAVIVELKPLDADETE